MAYDYLIMPEIGYRLSEPIKQYLTGEINKTEFKQEVRSIERSVNGANWWTISTAAFDEVNKSHYADIAEPLSEMYKNENLARVIGTDIMEQIE